MPSQRTVGAVVAAGVVALSVGGFFAWRMWAGPSTRARAIAERVQASALQAHLREYSRLAVRVDMSFEMVVGVAKALNAASSAIRLTTRWGKGDIREKLREHLKGEPGGVWDAVGEALSASDVLEVLETCAGKIEDYDREFGLAYGVATAAPTGENLDRLELVARDGVAVLGRVAVGTRVVSVFADRLKRAAHGVSDPAAECGDGDRWFAAACRMAAVPLGAVTGTVVEQADQLGAIHSQVESDVAVLAFIAGDD